MNRTYSYMRESPTYTLEDLSNALESQNVRVVDTVNSDIKVDLLNQEVLVGGEHAPITTTGMKALAGWLDIPFKFLDRQDYDVQQYLLDVLLERNDGEARVSMSDYGIEMIRSPKTNFVDPRSLVAVAAQAIDLKAEVVDYWNTPDEFRLDVIVPATFDVGIGGDLAVGDITRGGIRIGQNQRVNQTTKAPWVSEYLYRLVCTNGMEMEDSNMKIDARGASVEEVLQQLEVLAARAFSRVEQSISSFYSLRHETPEDPVKLAQRLAQEAGLAERMVGEIVEAIALMEPPVSVFDIVNAITNQANRPELRPGPRRKLERAGGGIVTQHHERCTQCLSRLD